MHERDLIDLNLGIHSNDFCALSRKETSDEFRQNDLLSIDGFPSHLRVSQMRRALQRKLQTQNLLVLGSVSVYGFCSTDLSRELERYRSLFAVCPKQTLPFGHSWWSLADPIIRKLTGHRSRALEGYQHLSPGFRQQTVELIAGKLEEGLAFSEKATKKATVPISTTVTPRNLLINGGADGTRTRDLRRDRPAF